MWSRQHQLSASASTSPMTPWSLSSGPRTAFSIHPTDRPGGSRSTSSHRYTCLLGARPIQYGCLSRTLYLSRPARIEARIHRHHEQILYQGNHRGRRFPLRGRGLCDLFGVDNPDCKFSLPWRHISNGQLAHLDVVAPTISTRYLHRHRPFQPEIHNQDAAGQPLKTRGHLEEAGPVRQDLGSHRAWEHKAQKNMARGVKAKRPWGQVSRRHGASLQSSDGRTST